MLLPLTLSLQELGFEQIQFQVSQPESLTFRTRTRPVEGFSLFLSPAVFFFHIIVNNASFSPSPDNDRHFAFVKMAKEIKIIVRECS